MQQMKQAHDWISQLGLQPHPEGGYYCETYRSETNFEFQQADGSKATRQHGTAIYFLLKAGQCSHFHRLKADEIWHFYAGDPLCIHLLGPTGNSKITLGPDGESQTFQAVVPAGTWFAAEVIEGGAYTLVGCTMAPGFDFADFELAHREDFCREFPAEAHWAAKLCLD